MSRSRLLSRLSKATLTFFCATHLIAAPGPSSKRPLRNTEEQSHKKQKRATNLFDFSEMHLIQDFLSCHDNNSALACKDLAKSASSAPRTLFFDIKSLIGHYNTQLRKRNLPEKDLTNFSHLAQQLRHPITAQEFIHIFKIKNLDRTSQELLAHFPEKASWERLLISLASSQNQHYTFFFYIIADTLHQALYERNISLLEQGKTPPSSYDEMLQQVFFPYLNGRINQLSNDGIGSQGPFHLSAQDRAHIFMQSAYAVTLNTDLSLKKVQQNTYDYQPTDIEKKISKMSYWGLSPTALMDQELNSILAQIPEEEYLQNITYDMYDILFCIQSELQDRSMMFDHITPEGDRLESFQWANLEDLPAPYITYQKTNDYLIHTLQNIHRKMSGATAQQKQQLITHISHVVNELGLTFFEDETPSAADSLKTYVDFLKIINKILITHSIDDTLQNLLAMDRIVSVLKEGDTDTIAKFYQKVAMEIASHNHDLSRVNDYYMKITQIIERTLPENTANVTPLIRVLRTMPTILQDAQTLSQWEKFLPNELVDIPDVTFVDTDLISPNLYRHVLRNSMTRPVKFFGKKSDKLTDEQQKTLDFAHHKSKVLTKNICLFLLADVTPFLTVKSTNEYHWNMSNPHIPTQDQDLEYLGYGYDNT